MPCASRPGPRRQGIGFSPEIETLWSWRLDVDRLYVARGLASRLRLKLLVRGCGRFSWVVARGLASRLRLKLQGIDLVSTYAARRQGIGFSPEIETSLVGPHPIRSDRRQGIGFSPEIETYLLCGVGLGGRGVARGLASRLRLKLLVRGCGRFSWVRRQGIGFSPEIETAAGVSAPSLWGCRQGIGFSPEIETLLRQNNPQRDHQVARGLASRLRLKQSMQRGSQRGFEESPGDWLLA